jgi:multidrug efflux pump subunit AcrB
LTAHRSKSLPRSGAFAATEDSDDVRTRRRLRQAARLPAAGPEFQRDSGAGAVTGIVNLALRRPYTFVVMGILILVFGVTAALRTPTDIFPDVKIPVITVVWSYNGLPPDDMSGRIVAFYERALTNSVGDIEHTESQSMADYGVVKIYFQPTVNINAALAEVTAVSQTVLKQMPPGITPPLVLSFDASSVPILQLALSSDKLSDTKLYDYGLQFMRPQLTSVAGSSIPAPYGGKVRQVQADLNQQALHRYGISANDVINALSLQNLITPVGTQKIGKLEYTVNLNDSPQRIEAFNNLPIKTVNGTVIYMRDVAYVHDGSPPQTNVVHVNGKNAVLMSVFKTGAASTLNIISGIKHLLPMVSETMPSGLHLTAVGDQSVYVTSAVSSVMREGVIAAALTAAMILLFLGSWRSTLIITVSIPLAVLSSLAVLSVIGETINVMTLGGLALAVGILVDDATVTIENINRHMELGQDIRSAILTGAHEIMGPATVSLLCISAAFTPMFLLGGVSGYLFRPLAEAFVFALVASYLLTYTLVPTMANFLLRGQTHGEAGHGGEPSRNPFARLQQRFETAFEAVRARYLGLLHLCLEHRRGFLAAFLGVCLISFSLAPFLGQDFFPAVDGGQIKLHIRARTGTRIEETTKLADQVGAEIQRIIPAKELAGVVDNIGLSASPINTAYNNSGTIGMQDADILVSLNPEHAPTADYVRALREDLPRKFPGVDFAFLPADMITQVLNFGVPAPIDLQIVGDDPKAERAYADALLARIKRIPGAADARIQQAFQEPTLDVNVNRSLAGLVGISERNAATALLDTLAGSTQTSPTFWLNPKTGVSYPVAVQTPQRDIDTLGGLNNIPLTTGSGSAPQLLGGVATIKRSVADASVSHYNVRRVIDIYATPEGRDLGAVAHDVRGVMQDLAHQAPKGTRVQLRGQVATMSSAYQQLFIGLGLAVLLIYLLIVVNFQSWVDPFIVIAALPAALAGVCWMLFATGTTLSVPALTGAIMCMGVATANSLLVIAFARERLADGVDALSAALEAGATRFRPVVMTATAMIIGMLPMALEPGPNEPLGRAVIGGLLFATCATLVFVPTAFSLIHGRRAKHAPAPAPLLPNAAADGAPNAG